MVSINLGLEEVLFFQIYNEIEDLQEHGLVYIS